MKSEIREAILNPAEWTPQAVAEILELWVATQCGAESFFVYSAHSSLPVGEMKFTAAPKIECDSDGVITVTHNIVRVETPR